MSKEKPTVHLNNGMIVRLSPEQEEAVNKIDSTPSHSLASDKVTIGSPEGAVKLPEEPQFFGFALYKRSPVIAVDVPVKDDDGEPVIYTDAVLAVAHLEMLPPVDREKPVGLQAVYYIRAIHTLSGDGTPTGWYNWVRLKTEETSINGIPHTSKFPDPAEKAAMDDFRESRKSMRRLSQASRDLYLSAYAKAMAK